MTDGVVDGEPDAEDEVVLTTVSSDVPRSVDDMRTHAEQQEKIGRGAIHLT